MKKLVYVDHSATTYVKKEVLDSMLPYFSEKYGNASSVYSIGRDSKEAVDKSREIVSNVLNCNINEIYFTSGGSESDNLAILGIARASKNKNHIITTKIEHLAVLNTCEKLEEEGFKVTYLDVDSNGRINLSDLKNSITDKTLLISIMFANNEIGTIQDIVSIGKIAKEHNVIFHTDAVQAVGNVKIDVDKLNISALSMSAHKFYGPKGVGVLYIKSGIKFEPVIHGGHQEKSMRAGTENVAGIVGLAKALEIADSNIDSYNKKLIKLRDYTINKINENISNVILNGDKINRLPGNVNMCFKGIERRIITFNA